MLTVYFEVRCPDGQTRHLPYHNEEDARSDAGHFSDMLVADRGGCQYAGDEPNGCPGGQHTVEQATGTISGPGQA